MKKLRYATTDEAVQEDWRRWRNASAEVRFLAVGVISAAVYALNNPGKAFPRLERVYRFVEAPASTSQARRRRTRVDE
jgi:hypothetical protein